jgi:hypothetical protein
MADKNEIKRLNYFTGQFLVAQDFLDEQAYHIKMRRRLNRMLYSPGVVDDGFEVTISLDKKQIIVSPGFAIDAEGRELLIIASQTQIPKDKDDKAFAATTSLYVTLGYEEVNLEDDNRSIEKTENSKETYKGCIRITERAEISFSTELPADKDVGTAIPIAKLHLDADGKIQSVDTSVRQQANLVVSVGKVGIGTMSPKAKLEVANLALDETPFQPLLRLQVHQKTESNANVFDESKPSYGIEFYRKWNHSNLNNIQAGIYAWGTGNVGSGLAFRTKPPTGTGANLATRMVIADGGNVGIGTMSPKAKLEVGGILTATQDNESLACLTISPTFQDNGKAGVKHYGLIVAEGNVGIGTTSPESKLHIDGRVDITDPYKGGVKRFDGLWGSGAGGQRAQLVLSSKYSDLVIASSAGSEHGSTLTFAAYNPDKPNEYRKWVINQGKQFLEFGYSDTGGRGNPHHNINDTDTALTLDGVTKRVGIGTRTPGARLEVAGTLTATQDNEALIGLKIASTFQDNGKTGVKHYGLIVLEGNVGIGTTSPGSKLHIDQGRVDITASDVAGGGKNRFNGLLDRNSNGRGQLVLSSNYSDLVIASSSDNNDHGSTLTFATYNPKDVNDYRKWVINQGNWGTRKQFLDFGYSDEKGKANPHLNINPTNTVFTLDGVNKRVGIGITSPSAKLEVIGDLKVSGGEIIGKIRTSQEFIWDKDKIEKDKGDVKIGIKMWSSKTSVAFLTYVAGWFNGADEFVKIEDRDGYWWLVGGTGSHQQARARCIGIEN